MELPNTFWAFARADDKSEICFEILVENNPNAEGLKLLNIVL